MSASAYLRLTAAIQGLSGGSSGVDASRNIDPALGTRQQIALSSGDNTITIPTSVVTGTPNCVVIARDAAAQDLTLKGNAGDTGINLGAVNGPMLLPVDDALASFILNLASGTETIEVVYL